MSTFILSVLSLISFSVFVYGLFLWKNDSFREKENLKFKRDISKKGAKISSIFFFIITVIFCLFLNNNLNEKTEPVTAEQNEITTESHQIQKKENYDFSKFKIKRIPYDYPSEKGLTHDEQEQRIYAFMFLIENDLDQKHFDWSTNPQIKILKMSKDSIEYEVTVSDGKGNSMTERFSHDLRKGN